jgi:hypothetical protein
MGFTSQHIWFPQAGEEEERGAPQAAARKEPLKERTPQRTP